MFPDYEKKHCFWKVSPVFPSRKSKMYMKMNMEQRGIVLAGETKLLEEKIVSVPFGPPQISHGMV